ncbi:hypothetical protein HMF8227_00652 [Saliniradius amylolyticus]|uniref:Succinylglutamate desuccinylase/Aspartoacylase catalytic domain-containing protein n=1 Tax=Saliniradius amylolyticus TaxID=2183582 RepID=A0A2S2E0I1_9ALTE|nr:succinylglutamate desuccinylase/aspartoacylase family protein [Saliniradius amylolyticus]AWL11148.1 hypothetical protein HMF8227_00652 [Saliniradius amylolyticus]
MRERIALNPITDVYSLARGRDLNEFLLSLGGPSLLTFKGRDPSRCRVVVTLLHGNEPSGLNAIQALAQENWVPSVTCHMIVASTAAAATFPWFSHRMLPGQRDLNRCFSSSSDDVQSMLAGSIKNTISELKPECVIDLHNTSGSGPGFCVSTQDSRAHQALASCFTAWMIVTDIRLGSLMEQSLGCPVVTIEAGGAKDETANKTAYAGIKTLFDKADVFEASQPVGLLRNPRRFELRQGYSVAYLDRPDNAADVCLRTDIESLNFGMTPAGTHLGWVRDNALSPFVLDDNENDAQRYFRVTDNQLYTVLPLRLFMATSNADIARSDCLFYFIREGGS